MAEVRGRWPQVQLLAPIVVRGSDDNRGRSSLESGR